MAAGKASPAQNGHHNVDSDSDIDAYFTGPIDTTKASKLPYFMRIRGSVLPGLIIPLLFVTSWAVWITCVHKLVRAININSVLLTVLGFLVGLALSFRSSTAYERNLARIIWVHIRENEGDQATEDVLDKVTAINLLLAFCMSLKHKLRHQPEYDYKDLQGLITNLQTFAKQAHEDGDLPQRKALKTPLPLAYNIVISQITWLYVLFLPFQLVQPLGWIAIPGTLIAAYIILGFAAIGREIEDPFGEDVNDLNLDRYCESIAIELDMIMSAPPPNLKPVGWITRDDNYVMFPNTHEGYNAWKAKGLTKIREELKQKPMRHASPALAREARNAELMARNAEIEERDNESQPVNKKEERPAHHDHQSIQDIPGDPSDAV
ncbi:hypothetical protein ABW19_dt0203509 [Dactylella cylindrospora]|nr:hypothetical protein ABW19_dt0203509 [Dactylella cylindrospora]